MSEHVEILLARAIDFRKIIKNKYDIFDFSVLTIGEKLILLNYDSYFEKKIDIPNLKPNERAYIIINSGIEKYRKLAELTEDELKKLSSDMYFGLLKRNFKKYIRVDLFPSLSQREQQDIFIREPKWVMDHIKFPPKLTKERLIHFSKYNPEFIYGNIIDFSLYSTDAYFWLNMIRYNKEFMSVFIKNTNSLISKTDVRVVIRSFPEIIKLIDEKILSDSKLSCKEWVLLIESIISDPEVKPMFEGWSFSEEISEAIKIDSSAEILTGKSKLSKRFQNSIKSLLYRRNDITDINDYSDDTLRGTESGSAY